MFYPSEAKRRLEELHNIIRMWDTDEQISTKEYVHMVAMIQALRHTINNVEANWSGK